MKKKYRKPRIELIFIDNEISLALESTPPIGPNETLNSGVENSFLNMPFKIDVS